MVRFFGVGGRTTGDGQVGVGDSKRRHQPLPLASVFLHQAQGCLFGVMLQQTSCVRVLII